LGGRIVGMPVLMLTTIGRRSGHPHTTALTFRREEENLVIVASNGGARQHPAWYLNLNVRPTAEVQIGRERLLVRSREAVGPEYDRLWTRAVQAYRGYGVYQTRTARRIPVVVLEPVEK
jgi:deazaflavin-dependent oxidoreductase (nitroreductase family)